MKQRILNLALLAICAVSIAASYAGLSASLETNDIWWHVLAAMIAGATGTAIYVFWQGAFEAAVKPDQFRFRSAGWLATFSGALFLLGMSSWWNVAGIASNQVRNIALYDTVSNAETSFAGALRFAGGHKVYIPRLQSLKTEAGSLKECEGVSGCVTGSPGKKGVYQVLGQLEEKADGLLTAFKSFDAAYQSKLDKGKICLSEMREALGSNGNLEEKTNRVSKAADCVNGVIAEITGPGPMAQIANALEGFTSGIILPVSIKSKKQKQAIANILDGLNRRAAKIAADAKADTRTVVIPPVSLVRLSPMKAVFVHYDSLMPQWITGIGLDLLPLVLLWFRSILAASRRFKPHSKSYDLSVGELIDAMEVFDQVNAVRDANTVRVTDVTPEQPGQEPPALPDETESGK